MVIRDMVFIMISRYHYTGFEPGSSPTGGWVPPQPKAPPPPAGGGSGGDNDPVGALLFIEVVGSAVGLGYLTGSWWVFGVALAGLFWLFQQPRIALVLGVVYSAAIGLVAGVFANAQFHRFDATVVCGLLAFGIALALNVEYVRRIR